MSTTLDKIKHHQRILVTGERSSAIIDLCTRVLDHYKRPYDLSTTSKTSISDGPIVFIESAGDINQFDPHIALIDHVPSDKQDSFLKLADGIPKAGTLVYNKSDALSDKICSAPRNDVQLEPFTDQSVQHAAMTLMKRIGVNEDSFTKALKS